MASEGEISDNERIASALDLLKGDKANVQKIAQTVDKFFDNVQLDMEDWKLTMEECNDGTRIFIRFQFLVKK